MSRRGLLIGLIVSLAVNLFVLGGLAGAALMGFGRHGPPDQPGPPRLTGMGAELSPEHREAWQAAVHAAVQAAGPQIHQARTLRRQAWQTLATEPANPQTALAALDQARALEMQGRAEMDRAVVAFAATLPAPERSKLLDALSRAGPPRHGGAWSGGGPGPDHPPPPNG
ncbi:MAG: hypothetical protein JWQ97_1238 [Phenylobacterium sp.]|nr:hypothetical protein [Phenylobacterium sp.]